MANKSRYTPTSSPYTSMATEIHHIHNDIHRYCQSVVHQALQAAVKDREHSRWTATHRAAQQTTPSHSGSTASPRTASSGTRACPPQQPRLRSSMTATTCRCEPGRSAAAQRTLAASRSACAEPASASA